MTHHTDAERPWWRDRADEIELQVAQGKMSATACYTQMVQLLDADRRAPAAPASEPELEAALDAMDKEVTRMQPDRSVHWIGFTRDDRLRVVAAALAAAPQPPEAKASVSNGTLAAPVQLPEPQAEIEVRSMKTYLDLSIHEWRDTLPDGAYNIYTEHQVRELLAAHGIQERST